MRGDPTNPTAAQIKQLHRDNLQWPDALKPVPHEDWPLFPFGVGLSRAIAVWRSRKFMVIVWDQDGTHRLSVKRTDYDLTTRRPRADISWDDLMRLKSEAGYGHATAVELYPPEQCVVNVANMRHLFITDAPGFMWKKDLA